MILAAADEITFPDEGVHWTNTTGSDVVPLSAMKQMRYAMNNCYSASWAVIDHALHSDDAPGDLSLVQVSYRQNEHSNLPGIRVHYAIIVDGTWVIDFTARQFSKTESSPLIASVNDWKSIIDAHLHRLFAQEQGQVLVEAA